MPADLEKYVLPENPFKCGMCDARAAMKLNIDEAKFLEAIDREGDHEVGAGALAADTADTITRLTAEVERLRGLLKRWESRGCPDCGGDCSAANPPVLCCIMQETRAVLAQEKQG